MSDTFPVRNFHKKWPLKRIKNRSKFICFGPIHRRKNILLLDDHHRSFLPRFPLSGGLSVNPIMGIGARENVCIFILIFRFRFSLINRRSNTVASPFFSLVIDRTHVFLVKKLQGRHCNETYYDKSKRMVYWKALVNKSRPESQNRRKLIFMDKCQKFTS